jgi:hypothetical protein
MKIFSKIIASFIILVSLAQASRAESDMYLLNVEVKGVSGYGTRDFKVGDTMEVIAILADDPNEYSLKPSPTAAGIYQREFGSTVATIYFDSISFAKNWPGIISNDTTSTLELNKSNSTTNFVNFVKFSSNYDGDTYEHSAFIQFDNTIQNFRQGVPGVYTFNAHTRLNGVFHYSVRGDIKSLSLCDFECRTRTMYGIPNSTVIDKYNVGKINLRTRRPNDRREP